MADDLDSDYLPDELGGTDGSSKSENESSHQNVSEDSLIEDAYANVSGNKIIFPSTTPTKKKLPKKIIYQCSLCTFQTPLRHKLKRHFIGCKLLKRRPQSKHSQVTSGVNFKCEYCFFVTKTLDKLKKHKQSHASLIDLGLIECSHCTFKFFTLDEYKQHMKGNNALDGDNDRKIATPEYIDVSSGMWADSERIAIKREVCTAVKDEGDPMDALVESSTPTEKEILSNLNEDLTPNGVRSNKEGYRSETDKSGKTRDRDLENTNNVKITTATNKISTELLSMGDNPLVCQICCREAKNQLHLVVHVTLDHVKDGAPFSCLKPKCSYETVSRDDMKVHLKNVHKLDEKNFSSLSDRNSKNATEDSLECRMKELHGIDMDEAHVSTYPSDAQENDTILLTCKTCGHKSKTEFQMKIHDALKHAPKDEKLCPVEQCFFATGLNRHLRKHLQRVHKLGEHYFKDYGNEQILKKYKAVEKEETTEENLENVLEELTNPVEDEKKARVASASSEKKRFECQLCDFSTNLRSSERRHQKYVHTKKRCIICNKGLRGPFEMVWHKLVVHRDDSDIDLWLLKCDICNQWGPPMESYRHGASHDVPKVTFHTEYRKIPTGGYVSFLYQKHQQSKLSVKEEKSDVGYCIAPGAIKVLDWTKSDDEETSGPVDKQENVTIEFTEGDDVEVKTKEGIRNFQASCKWSLRCTLCPYETSLKKAAYKHGLIHYCKNARSKATFYKYFKNRKRGVLGFSYSIKNRPHKCNKCRCIGSTTNSLIKHKRRALPSNNVSKTSEHKRIGRKIKQISEKTSRPIRRTKHRPLKEEAGAEYSDHSISSKCIKEHKNEKHNTKNLDESSITKKENSTKNGNTIKKLEELLSDKLEGNDIDKPIVASGAESSDGNKKQTAFYSTDELNDIIGVTSEAPKAIKGNPGATDSDWIAALEDEILNEDEISDTDGNEVIRIEVTEEDDEENDDYNSFTSDVFPKLGKEKNPIATRIKCKNGGCSYFCYDIEEIQKHATRCGKNPVDQKIESKEEFLCQLCETTLPDKESLQSHIVSEHFSNIEGEVVSESSTREEIEPKPNKRILAKTRQSSKEISGKISFKCWMCNELIYYRGTLVNHTYVHAREEDNFKLKVRFTKYIGDTRVDTIMIKADPNYVPRESNNVPLYANGLQKRKRRPKSTTVLDYDPNLTVYSCDECNFKTNLHGSLTKHKGLHWTPEKEKAFKAGKWFTCGVCFFHCFDADTLKEHSEKHKSRPGGNINSKKVGLNSWYF